MHTKGFIRTGSGTRRAPHTRGAAAVWEGFPGELALVDRAGRLISTNAAWRRSPLTFGCVPGADLWAACKQAAEAGVAGAFETAGLLRGALGASAAEGQDEFELCVGQQVRWLRVRVRPLARQGTVLIIREDVTAEKTLELDLRHRAFHDALTGLPNRALLTDRLTHAVAVALRDSSALAVLFIDLDEFKTINDRFGHFAGDSVLCQAARQLAECVRASDTVGRWGGDEFVVIAEKLDSDLTIDLFVHRLVDQLETPMRVADRSLRLHASIGVSLLRAECTAEQLVEAADRDMIASRERRRATTVRHGHAAAYLRLDCEADLSADRDRERHYADPAGPTPAARGET